MSFKSWLSKYKQNPNPGDIIYEQNSYPGDITYDQNPHPGHVTYDENPYPGDIPHNQIPMVDTDRCISILYIVLGCPISISFLWYPL